VFCAKSVKSLNLSPMTVYNKNNNLTVPMDKCEQKCEKTEKKRPHRRFISRSLQKNETKKMEKGNFYKSY
jgi:hypothetical protein